MTKPDASAKAAAILERNRNTMRDIVENPEIAKGVVGTVVFKLIRSGEEVSVASIVSALEAIADEKDTSPGLNDVLALGALKVISDLLASPAD